MSITNNYKLTKNTVLDATKGGFLFFKQVIPELKLNSNNISCKSVKNPFYNDTKPGLSVYYWNAKWRFKDFGDETYSGDVFDFAAFHYRIDPIAEEELLLSTIMNAAVNFDESTINSWVQPNILNKDNDFI